MYQRYNAATQESVFIFLGVPRAGAAEKNLSRALSSTLSASKPLLMISVFLSCSETNWREWINHLELQMMKLVRIYPTGGRCSRADLFG
jgi:hypothetical protein